MGDEAPPAMLGFARAARVLAAEARQLGLTAPGFRAPPRLPTADRTIRRAAWGAVVSVRLRGRTIEAVVADMIEGILVANRLEGDAARRTRVVLAEAVGQAVGGPDGSAAEAA